MFPKTTLSSMHLGCLANDNGAAIQLAGGIQPKLSPSLQKPERALLLIAVWLGVGRLPFCIGNASQYIPDRKGG